METNKSNKRKFGSRGEKIAAEYLSKNGYQILCQNYRVGKFGEIDIIAQDSEYICFIEVKTRSSTIFGLPSEAVNRKKQENIRKIAHMFLKQRNLHEANCRFDVVEVLIGKDGSQLNLIKNAF